jgi:hypothetical protein
VSDPTPNDNESLAARPAQEDDTTTDWTPGAAPASGTDLAAASGATPLHDSDPGASGPGAVPAGGLQMPPTTDWTRPIAGWASAATPAGASPPSATPGPGSATPGPGSPPLGGGPYPGSPPRPPAFGATPGSGLSRDAAMPRGPGMDPLPPPSDEWRQRSRYRDGPGSGPIVFGLLLILGGGFLLARELYPDLRVNLIWPMVVIALGVVLVLLAFLRPPRDDRR